MGGGEGGERGERGERDEQQWKPDRQDALLRLFPGNMSVGNKGPNFFISLFSRTKERREGTVFCCYLLGSTSYFQLANTTIMATSIPSLFVCLSSLHMAGKCFVCMNLRGVGSDPNSNDSKNAWYSSQILLPWLILYSRSPRPRKNRLIYYFQGEIILVKVSVKV